MLPITVCDGGEAAMAIGLGGLLNEGQAVDNGFGAERGDVVKIHRQEQTERKGAFGVDCISISSVLRILAPCSSVLYLAKTCGDDDDFSIRPAWVCLDYTFACARMRR